MSVRRKTSKTVRAPASAVKRYVPSWDADSESWRVEAWIILRLVEDKAARLGEITSGSTTFAQRRERIRAAIISHHIEEQPIARKDGVPESYAAFFGRFYREPLIQKT